MYIRSNPLCPPQCNVEWPLSPWPVSSEVQNPPRTGGRGRSAFSISTNTSVEAPSSTNAGCWLPLIVCEYSGCPCLPHGAYAAGNRLHMGWDGWIGMFENIYDHLIYSPICETILSMYPVCGWVLVLWQLYPLIYIIWVYVYSSLS